MRYFSPQYLKSRFAIYRKVNWFATLYFNFKKFPFEVARQLPVFFYGSVRIHDISGNFIIDAPIKRGMIGFGQPFELISREQGVAEFYLLGNLTIKGHVHFGKDCLIYIGKDAACELGHMFGMGSRGKLVVYDRVIFGQYVRVGFETQIMDSNFHQMTDLTSGNKIPLTSPIAIGNYNWIGNRSTVMQKTRTPDNCITASNSLLNRDYSELGTNILIGGMPAKLLCENIARDWDGEKADMEKWLII